MHWQARLAAPWPDGRMDLLRCERRLFRLHLGCIGALLAAHLVVHALRRVAPDRSVFGLWPLVNLNGEWNLPTAFASLALLVAAALLFSIAAAGRRAGRAHGAAWLLLGGVFVALAIDEWLGLHELLNRPLREALNADGALYFAWVVPYALFGLLLLPLLWRFMRELEPGTRRSFVFAGVVYVTGALLLEMLGARIWLGAGPASRPYYLATTLEEVMEMVGIALFVRALVAHRRELTGDAPDEARLPGGAAADPAGAAPADEPTIVIAARSVGA